MESLWFRLFMGLSRRGLINWIPDKIYLKILYYGKLKKYLHLKNPKTFNEKLQWLKLNNRNILYSRMVDKFEAKQYVNELIGEGYTIPTIGIWDNFDEIDFEKLPKQFVLKCTHDSGGVCICRNKNVFDIDVARNKINKSLKNNYYWHAREWPYKNVKPRILCEQYMENPDIGGLRDYKFYCFNGEVHFLYISDGMENHLTAKVSFVTPDWKPAPFSRKDYLQHTEIPKKPKMLNEMIKIAEKLSKGQSFLRVDLYEINNRIYFSEFTFSPCSGFMPFSKDEWDLKLGQKIELY